AVAVVVVAVVATGGAVLAAAGASLAIGATATTALTVAGGTFTAYSTIQSLRQRDLFNNEISQEEADFNLGMGLGGLFAGPAAKLGGKLGTRVFKPNLAISAADEVASVATVTDDVVQPTGQFYSVAYEMKLANNLYPGKGAYSHFKAANTALDDAISSDAIFANSIKQLGITIPKTPAGTITGNKIPNWVWHHGTDIGVMQLVPQVQHTNGSIFWRTLHPTGKGGMSIWGGGYKR
ncbi:MAG: HNH endonuclease, partial [Flavobacterium sp.]|nr:HNH endonuclease [Flavobacterium sp.]